MYDCANDSIVWFGLQPPPPWYFCAGEWAVIITDSNGCYDTSSCVTVTNPPLTVQSVTKQKPLSYQIVDGSIFFSSTIVDIRMVDVLGHVVLNSTNREINQLNLPNLPTGFYILSIKSGEGAQLTEKLLIKRE